MLKGEHSASQREHRRTEFSAYRQYQMNALENSNAFGMMKIKTDIKMLNILLFRLSVLQTFVSLIVS